MKIELKQGVKNTSESSTLVLFLTQPKVDKGDKKGPQCAQLPSELKKLFNESVDEKTLTGALGETIYFRNTPCLGNKNVLFLGLGSAEKITCETLRNSAATLEGFITVNKIHSATIYLSSMGENPSPDNLQAFIEGLGLSNYKFNELMTPPKEKPMESKVIIALDKVDRDHKTAFETGKILSEMVGFSRRLGDLPGNLMTPTNLAAEAQRIAKGTSIKVTIWNKEKIKKERMGGLLCVAQGSEQDPRFIKMEYKGTKASEKPIVFVGKGLTFDSGGISLKPGAGMEEMKYDMCGGANVIGAIAAIARLKLKVNVVALIPSTENLVNGKAIKPGDVVRARNGKTYEVNNTDAEGRLILSDALCIASELKPKAILDMATLTGAMVIALGNTHTGYFTKDDILKSKIEDSAKVSGELVWHMPLCEFHTKDMKGTFADLSNLASSRGAGSATAAAFLEQFVESNIPWAHFDIAGTGWATGNRFSYNPKKGASGVMIRTFVEIAKKFQ